MILRNAKHGLIVLKKFFFILDHLVVFPFVCRSNGSKVVNKNMKRLQRRRWRQTTNSLCFPSTSAFVSFSQVKNCDPLHINPWPNRQNTCGLMIAPSSESTHSWTFVTSCSDWSKNFVSNRNTIDIWLIKLFIVIGWIHAD